MNEICLLCLLLLCLLHDTCPFFDREKEDWPASLPGQLGLGVASPLKAFDVTPRTESERKRRKLPQWACLPLHFKVASGSRQNVSQWRLMSYLGMMQRRTQLKSHGEHTGELEQIMKAVLLQEGEEMDFEEGYAGKSMCAMLILAHNWLIKKINLQTLSSCVVWHWHQESVSMSLTPPLDYGEIVCVTIWAAGHSAPRKMMGAVRSSSCFCRQLLNPTNPDVN